MADEPRALRMHDLQALTPRQLEDLAAERSIPVPPRTTSEELRQALVGGSGTLTSADVPAPDRRSAYEGLHLDELKKLADERGVEVSGRKKADYVDALAGA